MGSGVIPIAELTCCVNGESEAGDGGDQLMTKPEKETRTIICHVKSGWLERPVFALRLNSYQIHRPSHSRPSLSHT